MAVALRQNNFGHFRIERGDKQAWAIRAFCHECKKTEDVTLTGGKSSLDQDFAERGFRNKGWTVGKDRNHDRCPDCIATELAARKAAQQKALDMLPTSTPLKDPCPAIPEVAVPRKALNRLMNWEPSKEEIEVFLQDRQRAVGYDPKVRREGQNWYPAITRGGENFIRSLIETRIAKNQYGLFNYEGGWDDYKIADLVNKLYPQMKCGREMVRPIRVLFFGPARRKVEGSKPVAPAPVTRPVPTLVPKAIPEPQPQPVAAFPAPAAAPAPVPAPTPVSAPEKAISTIEQDLLHLFEEVEKLKADRQAERDADNRTVAMLAEAIGKVNGKLANLESDVKKLGTPGKSIEDYTVAELLAEIGRRAA